MRCFSQGSGIYTKEEVGRLEEGWVTPKKHYLQKMNLLLWSLTGYTLGQTPGPEVVGQYTANSVVILLTCFGRAIFFLISLLLVYFIYVLLFLVSF